MAPQADLSEMGRELGMTTPTPTNILIFKIKSHISGGWSGIRTHETLAGLPVFKTGAFNRSATHPARGTITGLAEMPIPSLHRAPIRSYFETA